MCLPPSSRRSAHTQVLTRQVLRPLGGKVAGDKPGGLTHLDQVAVWVPHVAADLSPAVDRRREKVGAPCAPIPIAGVDISDAEIQEDGGGVSGLVIDDRD